MTTKRKYIDSHWLVFAVQGILAMLYGVFMTFTGIENTRTLVVATSIFMLCFGIIELGNLLRRTHLKETWGLSLAIAAIEVCVGLALLFTIDQSIAWPLAIIAIYTIARGILEIFIGLKSIDDRTDKAIWTICGICGSILGFVILNSGGANATSFLRAFGIYMIIFGLSSLIYGFHNRDQKLEYRESRKLAAHKTRSSNRRKNAKKR